jgi:AcrR family transcriptional regulator
MGTDEDRRSFEPWRHRSVRLDGRRRALFALAAPVFRSHGYRGATIKALAHACGLRPATLYHYFRSKADMATCLLGGPRMDWDSTWVDPGVDPVDQLARLLDLAVDELPNYLLAMRLAAEIAGGHGVSTSRSFHEGEAVFGRLIAAVAPGMSRAQALRVARDALAALVGSAVMDLDTEPRTAVRERGVMVLRAALVPADVEPDRFDAAMRP